MYAVVVVVVIGKGRGEGWLRIQRCTVGNVLIKSLSMNENKHLNNTTLNITSIMKVTKMLKIKLN